MYLKKYYRQTATYWGPGAGFNEFGTPTFAAPVTVACRWEDVLQSIIDSKGQEITSTSTVAVDVATPIAMDGYLFRGVSVVTDPRTVVGAQQIRVIHNTPDLRNLVNQQVALL
jgi:hypothetical protein